MRPPSEFVSGNASAASGPNDCLSEWAYPDPADHPESEPLDDRHVRLPPAFTHRLHPVPPTGPLELVEQRGHEPHAGGTERVAERDGAAVDVHLVEVGAGLLLPGEHDGCEGFVDLDEVHL